MRMPRTPPSLHELIQKLGQERFFELTTRSELPDDRYFHWEEVRRHPTPAGLTTEEWWFALRYQRMAQSKQLPLRDAKGKPFTWFLTDTMQLLLHQIDMRAGGAVSMPPQVASKETQDQYYISSLMEEAITSSQIEGAATTREVAKEMLRTQRKPKDTSERMILNNYQTMQEMRRWKSEKLTPALIFEIHRRITEDTLDDPTATGRLRRTEELVEVVDEQTEEVLHVPPPAETLEKRLQAMCDFANQADDSRPFVHPIVRAVILHFWLAYDHPFKDGNGRTARALFYWLALNRGFWLFEFISISQIILRSRKKYGEAFLKTETDGNDVNYFLLHQFTVIEEATRALYDYIERKSKQIREASSLLRGLGEFNHRQEALLNKAIRHPDTVFTIESHQNSHRISYGTARSDVLGLAEKGFLSQRKKSKSFVFEAVPDLETKLKR
jgi:Fic family protein